MKSENDSGRPASSHAVDLSLIIPAYNEAQRIAATLAEARGYLEGKGLSFELLVGADGTDGTREIVREMARTDARIQVFGSAERRGKGHAIREGVALARGRFIGFADADGKTPLAEFDRVRPHLEAGADLVIGSRRHKDTRIENPQPWYRQIGSKVFALFMHPILGLWDITDTQCGFKFFQHAAAKDLFRRQFVDGYIYDVEILFLARRRGYRIVQVPVRWRDDGDSRLDLVRGNAQCFWDVVRIRFHRYPD